MAALLGSVKGTRGEATRLGSAASGMEVRAQTWQTFARIGLGADGSGLFTLKDDSGRTILVLRWGAESLPDLERIEAVQLPGQDYATR